MLNFEYFNKLSFFAPMSGDKTIKTIHQRKLSIYKWTFQKIFIYFIKYFFLRINLIIRKKIIINYKNYYIINKVIIFDNSYNQNNNNL